MSKKRHTTLLMTRQDQARLEQIARELGYLQTRGPGAGQLGSISALVCAIARGHVELVPAKDTEGGDKSGPNNAVTTEDLEEA